MKLMKKVDWIEWSNLPSDGATYRIEEFGLKSLVQLLRFHPVECPGPRRSLNGVATAVLGSN